MITNNFKSRGYEGSFGKMKFEQRPEYRAHIVLISRLRERSNGKSARAKTCLKRLTSGSDRSRNKVPKVSQAT